MKRIRAWLRWLFRSVECCGCGGPEAAVELIPTSEHPAAERYCRTCYDAWPEADKPAVRWIDGLST